MVRLIMWGMILYLAWQAYKIVKDQLFTPKNNRVNGQANQNKVDLNEDDILDAEFKDIKKN